MMSPSFRSCPHLSSNRRFFSTVTMSYASSFLTPPPLPTNREQQCHPCAGKTCQHPTVKKKKMYQGTLTHLSSVRTNFFFLHSFGRLSFPFHIAELVLLAPKVQLDRTKLKTVGPISLHGIICRYHQDPGGPFGRTISCPLLWLELTTPAAVPDDGPPLQPLHCIQSVHT